MSAPIHFQSPIPGSQRAISLLKPSKRNPRIHDQKQIKLIAASIERFGFTNPIIIDENNQILAGHGRYEAAMQLGLSSVPIIALNEMTEAQKRAYILADNKIAELSSWDRDLLASELEFLISDDFDFEVTGFEMAEIDLLIGSEEAGISEESEDVALPEPGTKSISRPGDMWIIGPHRLICGDARDPDVYERLLGDDRTEMVFTDPPYNVPIQGHVSGLGKVSHREFAMASGEMSQAEFIAFLRATFRNCVRFSINGSIHYHCMDFRHMRELQDASDGVYGELKQLVVWAKTNAGMGAFYRSQHELVFVFKSGRAPHINNFGLGEKGRYRTNVWTYPGANTFRKGRDADLESHPTVKPVAMVADAMLDCSNRGGIVLDPFAGSGTTLLAAHRTGRRSAAIEIDPLYVDCAIRRLQAASGLEAVRDDGVRFDDLAALSTASEEMA